MTGQRGRPRDPDVTVRAVRAAITVLAERGMRGFTADEVAAVAAVGKASIYRRWSSLDELLVDVVVDLGVREVPWGPLPGSARGDMVALLTAACTGPRAMAEVELLPVIGRDERLHRAYMDGPVLRLVAAVAELTSRAHRRGESVGFRGPAVAAAVAVLHRRMATRGQQAHPEWVSDVVDTVALPAVPR
ncbi:TetR family transcriptional regulator [Blastococcus xanthinilyticus]|uniref:TetR family transcriptional regulator n=1 Tax=Blastococcus xanthinilyticus TaxID=1564164 RepID=A0A5S5CM87_9ACTN|nr:TetR family transcriptional regulator [Blastococcus xanthinilyticus]TYP82032.1 TetR family transcriptional regulator [Blastococcus xanthinilyticus]